MRIRDWSSDVCSSDLENEAASGEIVALIKDGTRVDALKAGERGIVILNQTPFYAESGGQVGDRGALEAKDARFNVEDTQKKLHEIGRASCRESVCQSV